VLKGRRVGKNKPSQEKDIELERIKAIWPRLMRWQKKRFLLYLSWFLFQERISDIPIRWLKWQVRLIKR
jgi:hypothetical protein